MLEVVEAEGGCESSMMELSAGGACRVLHNASCGTSRSSS